MRLSNTLIAVLSVTALGVSHVALSASNVPQPTSETALGTAEQRAVETHAIKILHSQPMVYQMQKSTARFNANPAAQSADGKPTLSEAVHELAFAAALNAANSDPTAPKIA